MTKGYQFSSTPTDLKIMVPPGKLATYQDAAGWKEYKDKIREVGQVEMLFNHNYGTTPTTTRSLVSSGGAVNAPTAPTRTGYTFAGWYKNTAGTGTAWNFTTALTADTTLYAKWTADS